MLLIMKNALIIFVRIPELGKVKTRLAKDLGEEKALEVYKELLQHTHDISVDLECDKFVFYTDRIENDDIWENDLFSKYQQEGDSLGDRMMLAFHKLLQLNYKNVVIIGSDCPSLSPIIINEAFERLENDDIVIGPSSDGGYYLLGMSKLFPELFQHKKWSSDSVLADTIKDTVKLQKQYSFLTELSDIDTIEDYQKFYLSN